MIWLPVVLLEDALPAVARDPEVVLEIVDIVENWGGIPQYKV